MAKEKFKEKEIKENGIPYENIRYIQKYGLSKIGLENEILRYLKFESSFKIISNYLQEAIVWIENDEVAKCLCFIERAKYVLRGCKE